MGNGKKIRANSGISQQKKSIFGKMVRSPASAVTSIRGTFLCDGIPGRNGGKWLRCNFIMRKLN